MDEPIAPIGPPPPERRVQARREGDREPAPQPQSPQAPCDTLPAVIALPTPCEQPDPRDHVAGYAAFAVQVLGQPGEKRGLRGGPETLERARSAYLGVEYSGPADRRPPRGRVSSTDI